MTTKAPDPAPSPADDVMSSDLAKVDAHVITAEEYEELTELTDEMMGRAEVRVGGRLVRRGQPPEPDTCAAQTTASGLAVDIVANRFA